jgi:hypothetical protein
MEKDLRKRIDETLALANQIKPVSPKPFFYTRLKAKMEEETVRVISSVPVPIKIACSLVLLVNIAFFSLSSNKSQTDSSEQLASFYEINSSDY